MEDEIVRMTPEQREEVRSWARNQPGMREPVAFLLTPEERAHVRRSIESGRTSWRDSGTALLQVL